MNKVILPKFKPATFIDRDGVINQKIDNGFVLSWDEFKFIPDAITMLQKLHNETGLDMYVVSNQKCVGIGLITMLEANVIMDEMIYQLRRNGIDDPRLRYMICPHTDEQQCSCRKPKPGMLYYIARTNDICLEDSYMIGDTWTDCKAALNAGLSPGNIYQYIPGLAERYSYAKDPGNWICNSLIDIADWIIRKEQKC